MEDIFLQRKFNKTRTYLARGSNHNLQNHYACNRWWYIISAYCLVIDEIKIRCNSNWTMSTLHSAIQLLATTMRTIILRSTMEPGSIVDNSPPPRHPRASRDVVWRHTRPGRYHEEIRSARVCACASVSAWETLAVTIIIGGSGSAAVVETANCWQFRIRLKDELRVPSSFSRGARWRRHFMAPYCSKVWAIK